MSSLENGFLSRSQISDLLGFSPVPSVSDRIDTILMNPIADLYARPGKQVRGRLVELGFRMSECEVPRNLIDACSEVIEAIHAGSLVVDDIHDGSKVRRGQPALHLKYGLPIALNAGNWLYFWPMELIKNLKLSAQTELAAYRACHQLMIRAHVGQGLDVGVRIDTVPQTEVPTLCRTSVALKSGELMGLAFEFGAIISAASSERCKLLREFGMKFGTALQAFDDIGNLRAVPSKNRYDNSKRFEDLYLRRPSWIWLVAATEFDHQEFDRFVYAIQRLPDESFLNPWIDLHGFVELATRQAVREMDGAVAFLVEGLTGEDETSALRYRGCLAQIKTLADKVKNAYGSRE